MKANKTKQPRLSFITVNYNGVKETLELVDSILRVVHSVTWEIIVIDNGSLCNEALEIANHFPTLKGLITLRSEVNRGFAGGNNLGIERASGEYLFFINNDTFIEEDHFDLLLNEFTNDPTLGALSPKIRFAEGNRPIQFAGYTLLTPITLRNKLIGYGEEIHKGEHRSAPSPYLHGAAMLLRRELIDRVGKMPECYFLYYEELDWSCRITQEGYRILYSDVQEIFHKESRSTGQNSPLRTYYLTRNRLLFARRNRSRTLYLLSFLYQVGIAAPKAISTHLIHQHYDLAAAVVRGIRDYRKTGKTATESVMVTHTPNSPNTR